MARKDTAGRGILAQVAAQSQVSIGTVSRVFNNSEQIPAATRVRVMQAARELGIRPRVGVRTRQIALITEPPWKTRMGGYVNTLTQYVSFALSKANAGISLITEDRIGALSDCWFDGIIGIAWEDSTVERIKALGGVPVVWFSDMHSDAFHAMCLDRHETGAMAGDYLLGCGHRRIAVIHDADYTGEGRAEGVARAMAARGLDPAADLLRIPNAEPMYASVKRVVDAGCTALWVTGEDMRVLEAGWLIQELAGKRIPEDISLLGFENPGISEFQRPALTTLASPLQEMAEQAVATVLAEPQSGVVKRVFKTRIIERGSVRRIA